MTPGAAGGAVPGVTRAVVERAIALRLHAVAPSLRREVRRLWTDGVGVMLAGLGHPNVALLARHVAELGCRPVSPVYGHALRTSPQEAAFVLGTATHVLDFEPMFDPPTHPVSPVLGALVALLPVAPADGGVATGERLLRAFAAGIQLQADLRTAARAADGEAAERGRHFPFQRQGFHPPGTVGVLGSALAASVWLGLSPSQACMALGIAASRAGGVAGNIGTMTKATHSGHAARAGVESALLARQGFTASEATLEGASGWGAVFGGDAFDAARVADGMATLDSFVSPGYAFKRWPAHTAMQVAIAAALPLHDPARPLPEAVHIEAPRFPYCDRPSPRDTDEARFSFQYNVAQALLDGAVGMESFTPARLGRPALQQLLARCHLVLDPAIPAEFPRMEVRVRTSDGRVGASDRWPGHWKSPAADAQLRAKFLACAAPLFGSAGAEAVFDLVDGVLDAPDLEPLRARLGAAGSAPTAPSP